MLRREVAKGWVYMAKHAFGIMTSAPTGGERYDEYEPEKYGCIFVDDDHIEGIRERLLVFDSFCHTVDIPMKGLNDIGITLIPPASMDAFLAVVAAGPEYTELRELLNKAKNSNRYVIHYGL